MDSIEDFTHEELEDDRNQKKKDTTKSKRRQLGLSCMLSTEVGAVLAVIRRYPEFTPVYNISSPEESYDSSIINSLRSLRSLIFNPQQEWRTIDPSIYLTPFLDVIQSDDVPASATGVALSSILKILKFQVFDDRTPGAKEAMESVVVGITSCRLEKTDPVSEDVVMMKILQVLAGIMHHKASVLLSDQAVCTLVNACFQVVQQSVGRGDLLQRSARYTMHELIQAVYARLPEIEGNDREGDSESDVEDVDDNAGLKSGYGVRAAIDIFHFLCSLLNVVSVVEADGSTTHTADEDVQIFALVLINSAIELSGDKIGNHPKLLRMVQDDLFHHLIYYGTWSSSFVLSMICSTVLNAYHFLRKFLRFQLEAFFGHVLIRVATLGSTMQLQEVAVEGIINFCRQPTFIAEVYANYDCNPLCRNIFEEVGRLLCKHSFALTGHLTSLHIQAFEGLLIMIHNIADNIDKIDNRTPLGPYTTQLIEYKPFWEEKEKDDDLEAWVEHVRITKVQKKKLLIAANHFNRDNKKGLEYLKHAKLISDPPDPKSYAYFFRFTPGLDKKALGEYLGDPDSFYLEVLREFTETFHFNGMVLDTGLRFFLESFWLPGESQKIERVLDAFSNRFYDQQSSDLFASKDTVLILCYSLIMLNTDHHNAQVKKKMTEEEFIKNNRTINSGQDLPREYLSELFQSITNNAIVMKQTELSLDMTQSKWTQLINQSKVMQSFVQCEFDRRMCRDMFACIAGPSVAALSSFFEHADEEELMHECIEGLFSVARIAQYGLEDTLDELITSFCKFTTLLNPYASTEETMFTFSHDMKPRLATVAVFTLANDFRDSIRGGWKNIVDCLLKLKRLRLLPQSTIDFDAPANAPTMPESSGVVSPTANHKSGTHHRFPSVMTRLSLLSQENSEDGLTLGSEFEQNLKMIKLCRIGSIFGSSSNIPKECLQNLGRSLIFAAAGKGQKFSTPVEEEETVGFCWDLITALSLANVHRFHIFWPNFHEYLLTVAQFPMFSPIPFAEKALLALLKVCLKLFSTPREDKLAEELIFKSITLMWKLDKEILDMCYEIIAQLMSKIVIQYPANLQTQVGWKSVLNLLSVAWRHPETYDLAIEALISLFSDATNVTRTNYAYLIDCAFGCFLAKNSPIEKKKKILDLLADSTNLLVQWQRTQYTDPGSNVSVVSNTSSSSAEDNFRGPSSANYNMNFLSRQEEIRNHAVYSLHKSFNLAEEMLYTSSNCISYFNLVIFAMVDELHEKMLEYSRRDNAEREMRSMEGTLKLAMELLSAMYLQSLRQITESPGFRAFWLGVLRRMDTCMKAELGHYGPSSLSEIIPDLLKKIITQMKDEGILEPKEDDDMWEITYIQIQWICPRLKDELFPL
ncbi:ARF guanine-nucleotide exchange factor GNOM protein [Medicago truncatula]|uniref:ARF guanine-nucleotide exchange factor GNOM protein n=1 Tax=Medicago truncatula TaxID=3880 RepID=G7KNH6_MEDTR|nr:ARF guanine-nucleotide exchange factor GNOM protein [Medicago truncatula]